MRTYLVRRLLLIAPTLFIVSVLVFLTARLIPGDVVDLMLQQVASRMAAGTQYELTAQDLRHQLGLDMPIHVQYGHWVGKALRGDLGHSLWKNTRVLDEIARRLPVSFELGFLAILAALVIAIPVGVLSAVRQDTWSDYVARSIAIACIALPTFWLATVVMVFPSVWWTWSPAMKWIPFVEDPGSHLVQIAIPAVILGMATSGQIMRMTRTMMLEVMRQDYIRTAWSKGVEEKTVIMKHALKNAMIPVITIVGLNIPVLVGTSVIVEEIFNLPGIGRLLMEVLHDRDYTMLSGINLFMATFVLVVNLVVDVTYSYLDPRVRFR